MSLPGRLASAVLAAALLFSPCYCRAQSASEARQEIKGRLVTMLDQWNQAVQDRARLQGEMQEMEDNIAREQREAGRLALRQREMTERLEGAQAEEINLRSRLDSLQERYHRQMRVLYLLGVEGDFGLLASARDYREVMERSQAVTWLLAGQHQRLNDLKTARQRLNQVQGNLALEQNQIDEVRGKLLDTQIRLGGLHQRRAELLLRLEQRRLLLIERISALQEAEARLARAFALPPLASGAKARPMPGVREAQGHLSPPVQGRVLGRGAGPLQPGITIKAAPGAPVRAPWAGRVAYAGELAHVGKVVVLDHGEKVHTVLGHLDSVAVSQGQQINPGEMVGALGPEGLLYLEVRLKTKAQDPRRWLRLNY
ncbi:MAG: peptidoglycan DD-metalloendopeptidase family protein [Desulfarculaceae bacterium]|nr:peptidoglycan DD-metalloendopeptidase family protein [Desulfarculaceae bacterium]MCF8046145.1 peptidoglycan DD-metalloendopeptidase family protein [Desulfarculaceae bacterium]MCF8097170.1 peptidoglycan DD-metalloendopeptidase family protein [Desulfarculaceae bacterium]MCF8124341.1 peptidoglycan DD-metalloendopeptidase family protein [Desulfarculaceae bacterium]